MKLLRTLKAANFQMITVAPYSLQYKSRWDNFVSKSKNGIFLFYRDYMEYHADRFNDHSLMFFNDKHLVAVMPANIKNHCFYSHQGLTYGGIITNQEMKIKLMLDIFQKLIKYLKNLGVLTMIYKPVPYVYHQLPAEEDLYALFKHHAALIRRDVSSAIFQNNQIQLNKGRKSAIKKAAKNGIEIQQSTDFETFMNMEEKILREKYQTVPAHNDQEIKMLSQKFPGHIKLFSANKNKKMLAGTIAYENKNLVHLQYIASSSEGRKLNALDHLINYLICDYYAEKEYFDFGISTYNNGEFINLGLLQNKEGFGARAIVFDWYKINLNDQN